MRTKTWCTVFCGILCFSGSMLMAQYQTPNQKENAKPFPWMESKRCAVSLTFDDARLSQIDVGIPLLDRYGVKATFYVSPKSMMERIDGWVAAAAEGHEIGNHTMTHPCSGNFTFARQNALEDYTLEKITAEMDQENDLIWDKLKVKVKTFAYPCGQNYVGRGEHLQSYIPIVAKKFITGRGWMNEDSNDPWYCDFAQLFGMESDGKTFEELKTRVDKTAKEGRWLVLAGHEIGQGGHQTTLIPSVEKLCQYAQDPANGIWIAPVATVAEYILKVRNNSKSQ